MTSAVENSLDDSIESQLPAGETAREHLIGRLAILISSLFFYLSTVPVSEVPKEVGLSSWQFTFYRMFVGLIGITVYLTVSRSWARPNNLRFLIGRGVLNLIALIAMYKSAELSTAMEANILNSAYPLFIAIIFFVWKPRSSDYHGYIASFVAVAGIFLTMGGEFKIQSAAEYWGIFSALLAAFAIISLNLARRGNDTNMVLFFLFLTGTVLMAVTSPGNLMVPDSIQFKYLAVSSVLGVIAQALLTLGARYVTPVESGILTSSRILIAIFLGQFIFGEKVLNIGEWSGALMIFGANVYMFRRRAVIV